MEDDEVEDSAAARRLEGNAIDDTGSPETIPPPPDSPQTVPKKHSGSKSNEKKSSGPSLKNIFSKSPIASEKKSSIRSVRHFGSKASKQNAEERPVEASKEQQSVKEFERPGDGSLDVSGSTNVNPPTFPKNSLNASTPSNLPGAGIVMPPPDVSGSMNVLPPTSLNASEQYTPLNLVNLPNLPESGTPEFVTLNSAPPTISNDSNQPNAMDLQNSTIPSGLPGAPIASSTPNPVIPSAGGFQNAPVQPNALAFSNAGGPQNAPMPAANANSNIMLNSGQADANTNFPCASSLLQKRSPFIHNPPQPEEHRPRIQCPRTLREYLINLREDLADFQESHGLPRTRDYSFVSLGLALAQETGRAIYSVFVMLTEMFPVLSIISLILRFALDKLIEILETTETIPKIKKTIIFCLEMLVIMIPLWILIGTIIIPLISLLFSILKRMLQIRGGKRKSCKPANKTA